MIQFQSSVESKMLSDWFNKDYMIFFYIFLAKDMCQLTIMVRFGGQVQTMEQFYN